VEDEPANPRRKEATVMTTPSPAEQATSPEPTDQAAAIAALEALAASFTRAYSTVLLIGDGRVPRLTVASRYARMACDIYADEGWYWTGEPARIAPVTDPASAARDLSITLGAAHARESAQLGR
jgi:hypothetical protein